MRTVFVRESVWLLWIARIGIVVLFAADVRVTGGPKFGPDVRVLEADGDSSPGIFIGNRFRRSPLKIAR